MITVDAEHVVAAHFEGELFQRAHDVNKRDRAFRRELICRVAYGVLRGSTA